MCKDAVRSSGDSVHVCACRRGSSMEGAAMELKVSLSIHK